MRGLVMPSFSYVCVDDNGIELRGVAAADIDDLYVNIVYPPAVRRSAVR
jgi:hypothetical protein